MTQREDTLVGSVVRLVLVPLATIIVAVLVPIMLYIASSVRSVAAEVQDTSVVVAEIHAQMQGADRRLDALENESTDIKARIRDSEVRIVEIATTIAAMR